MSEPRTIKKYPNRRLYDTVESRYITLADIRRLVIDRIDFVVMDKKTQEDITRSILLQVIAEQEHGGEPLMVDMGAGGAAGGASPLVDGSGACACLSATGSERSLWHRTISSGSAPVTKRL